MNDILVLDTRSATEFSSGFVPGSLFIGLEGRFAEWAGNILPFHQRMILITDPAKEEETIVKIAANIYCEKESHKSIIIGKKGAMLKKIGTAAREEIERFLNCKVYLELWVKVKEDWRNNEMLIKNFGFESDQ